jgi:hypothetical protein
VVQEFEDIFSIFSKHFCSWFNMQGRGPNGVGNARRKTKRGNSGVTEIPLGLSDSMCDLSITLGNISNPQKNKYDLMYLPTSNKFYLKIQFIGLTSNDINPLNNELNNICHLLALVGARHFVDVSRIKVKVNISYETF